MAHVQLSWPSMTWNLMCLNRCMKTWTGVYLGKLILAQSRNCHLLQNLKVYYCVHISLPLDPTLSQMNPPTYPPTPFTIHFNFILPSMPRFSEVGSFVQVLQQNFVWICHLIYLCNTALTISSWRDSKHILKPLQPSAYQIIYIYI